MRSTNHEAVLTRFDRWCSKNGLRSVLVHEAALAAWGIDYNAWIDTVDVLVKRSDFESWCDAISATDEDGIVCGSVNGLSVRLWTVDDLALGPEIVSVDVGYGSFRALQPETVLETMQLSPDSQFLYEQRALLAQIMYSDILTDDEIMLFHKYVRGD